MTEWTPPIYPDVSTLDRDRQIGRTNWQLQYSASNLAVEVDRAREYHIDRQDWWENEAAVTRDKIGEDGLQVREQQITGGIRHDVVIDPTLSARLSECESKISGHRSRVETLGSWLDFLRASERTLILTASDADFFEIGRHAP